MRIWRLRSLPRRNREWHCGQPYGLAPLAFDIRAALLDSREGRDEGVGDVGAAEGPACMWPGYTASADVAWTPLQCMLRCPGFRNRTPHTTHGMFILLLSSSALPSGDKAADPEARPPDLCDDFVLLFSGERTVARAFAGPA